MVLFELLTGSVPFRSSDVLEVLRAHATVPPTDLSTSQVGAEERYQVPTAAEQVLGKA